jgi:hypothetical protein
LLQFIEAGHGDHRPEHFALDDFIALFATGQQRRLVKKPAPECTAAPVTRSMCG